MSAKSTISNITERTGRRRVRAALTDLRDSLARLYGPETPGIVIYGSQARGQANAASDVDVLLLYAAGAPRGAEITRLSPILSDLNLRHQVLISVLPSSQVEYENAASPFWENVRREGVSLDAI